MSYENCQLAPHGVSQDSAQFSQTELSPVKETLKVSYLWSLYFKGLRAWAERGVKVQIKLALNVASKH